MKDYRFKRAASIILKIAFLAAVATITFQFNVNKPRVLILHSYSSDYAWTRGIDTGLHRVIDNWQEYSVSWHYMDTKRHTGKAWLTRAGIVARRAIDNLEPQVIIAIDDLAQKLAARYYVNDPRIKIVFAGVNGSIKPYGYDLADNVTGIFESKQLQAVKETIMGLENQKYAAKDHRPRTQPRILYLLDTSLSLQNGRSNIDNFDWGALKYIGSHMSADFDDWRKTVMAAAGKADYLLVANYRKLARSASDQSLVPPRETMAWTEKNSPVPVIGINSFNVDDGGMLSIGVSPYEQGEVAARMAEDLLSGRKQIKDLPPVQNQQFIIAIRKSAAEARGVAIPAVYEAFAKATANYIE